MVDGVAMAKKHQRTGAKRTRTGQQLNQGGIIDVETFDRHLERPARLRHCHQPTRVGHRIDDDGVKVRICRKCEAELCDGDDTYMPRLKQRYRDETVPQLQQELGLTNVMQVPALRQDRREHGRRARRSKDGRLLDAAVEDLTIIAGQKPVVTKARKSIAGFKLREGMAIGVKVTLRGDRMWEFLRPAGVAGDPADPRLPRARPARRSTGAATTRFGLTEQLIFPEIDYDKVPKVRGMDITIVTTARDDDEGRALLAARWGSRSRVERAAAS